MIWLKYSKFWNCLIILDLFLFKYFSWMNSAIISCPSKVLILGGYAILYEEISGHFIIFFTDYLSWTGITLATSAKFRSWIKSTSINISKIDEITTKDDMLIRIDVESLSLKRIWSYDIKYIKFTDEVSIEQTSILNKFS